MTKIERRRDVIALHHGHYATKLEDLSARALAAYRKELVSGARRASTKSEANKLAVEHDELLSEAEETAVKVTVWALDHEQWSELADQHEPREGSAQDAERGLNMLTFPKALLHASLVSPEEVADLDGLAEVLTVGKLKLKELGVSRVQYVKLERGAWAVNVGDDALPKSSLVSQLRQLRDRDSKPQPDTE